MDRPELTPCQTGGARQPEVYGPTTKGEEKEKKKTIAGIHSGQGNRFIRRNYGGSVARISAADGERERSNNLVPPEFFIM